MSCSWARRTLGFIARHLRRIIRLPNEWDQCPPLPLVFRVYLPESRGKRGFLHGDAHYVGDGSERQKRSETYPVADRNAEPEKRRKRTGVGRVAKPLVGPGRDQALLLPHDHMGSKEIAESLNRPKTERHARPDECNADRDSFGMHGELWQKRRQDKNAHDYRNNPRNDQQAPGAAVLRSGLRIAPFAHDEPYLDGDPRPITHCQHDGIQRGRVRERDNHGCAVVGASDRRGRREAPSGGVKLHGGRGEQLLSVVLQANQHDSARSEVGSDKTGPALHATVAGSDATFRTVLCHRLCIFLDPTSV
jgi:hypothetical protein